MNNMVLATIKECDNIIVLDKGKLLSRGHMKNFCIPKANILNYGKCSRVI